MPLTLGDLIQTGAEIVVLTGSQLREFAEVVDQLSPDRVNHAQVKSALSDAGKLSGYSATLGYARKPGTQVGRFAGRDWFAEKLPSNDYRHVIDKEEDPLVGVWHIKLSCGHTLSVVSEPKPGAKMLCHECMTRSAKAAAAKPAVNWDWTGSGLSIEQLQFARAILGSVIREFRGGATVLMDLEGRVARPEALAHFEAGLVKLILAYDAVRTHKINYLTAEYRRLLNQTVPAGRTPDWASIRFGEATTTPEYPVFPFPSKNELERARQEVLDGVIDETVREMLTETAPVEDRVIEINTQPLNNLQPGAKRRGAAPWD